MDFHRLLRLAGGRCAVENSRINPMKITQIFRNVPVAIIAAVLSISAPPQTAAGEKIRFVSFHVPPFSIKDGAREGFVKEIARELSRRLAIPMEVRYATSAKTSLKMVKAHPNTLVFPLARTRKRETHFTWVVKVRDIPLIFASAPGKTRITSIKQAKAASAIGVRLGFAANDLKKRGFRNLLVVSTPEENARALAAGRIAAWYAPGPEILYTWRLTGHRGKIGRGLTTKTVRSYIAASKSSPLVDVKKWQAAFAAMKRDGEVKRIVDSYLGQE